MAAKPTILIADDDDDYRASLRGLLEGEGYAVIEAASGREALAAAREHRPALIVLDVMMEHISAGYSVVQALKCDDESGSAHLPIIMVSSVEVDPGQLFGWIADASPITPDAYMTKPLDIPEFLKRVKELVHRSENPRA